MNPPTARPPSRFIRGRGRGGGSYRPYFYFRRNGRVIPACGGPQEGGEPQPSTSRAPRTGRGRGRRNFAIPQHNNSIAGQLGDSTFLRPELFAAPENALQVQIVAVDEPLQCPGWRLYFPTEDFKQNSDLAKRIKIIEAHYTKNPVYYDFLDIQSKTFFMLQSKIVTADEEIMEAWPSLLQDLQCQTQRTLATFGVAMYMAVTMAAIDASVSQQPCTTSHFAARHTRIRKIYVRPIGFMGVKLIAEIDSSILDNLFCVRGAVVAMGSVEAPAAWIAYKCDRCRQEQALRQSGFHPARPYSCKRDDCHAKKGFVEQRASPFTRIAPVQIIRVAEKHLQSLNDLDVEQTECIDIELRQDLVDAVVCGQDIIITGILKRRSLVEDQQQQPNQYYTNTKSNTYQIYLKAASIEDATHVPQPFSQRDMEAISMINGEADCFKLLVQSVAPELHGHEVIKAGVLLSLFGGAGSQVHDQTEINVLLVGDPGIGKSHVLQMCAKLSQNGALLSGKQGSAAGNKLTAAIQGRSNYSIAAGAIINSINGHCAIDDIDRFASQQETLLQVMQTQSIAIPFPSVCSTLNAPAAIIATANPIRGHYDHSKLLTENIRINPSLLNGFQLVFVLLDRPNKDLDASLTEHIKALHAGAKKSANIAARFAMKPKTNNSMNITMHDEHDEDDENYELGKRLKLSALEEDEIDLLPPILVRKFIAFARQQVKPLLTAEAAEALKEFYMQLKQQQTDDKYGTNVSSSQLEGLIRLAQARARIDFASEATKSHVRDVIHIVEQSLADTAVGDYVDCNPATALAGGGGVSKSGAVKKFVQMLQRQTDALSRRIFDFEELKDMARNVGITCGVSDIVDVVNMQGFLLKRGPNLYEVMPD